MVDTSSLSGVMAASGFSSSNNSSNDSTSSFSSNSSDSDNQPAISSRSSWEANSSSQSSTGALSQEPTTQQRILDTPTALDALSGVDTTPISPWNSTEARSANRLNPTPRYSGPGSSPAAGGSSLSSQGDTAVDILPPATGASVVAGTVIHDAGSRTLINNPELIKSWESTTSAWTGKGGFTDGAISRLQDAGIYVNSNVNQAPAGSISRVPGISPGSVTTHNGDLARDAIANRAAAQGLTVNTEVHFDANFNRMPAGSPNNGGSRHVDVEVERPHPTDPRLNQVEHIESKATRVNAGTIPDAQLAHDAGMLDNNRAVRAGGEFLEKAGRVARPVGLVVDSVNVIGAIRQDGGIGENTGRTVTGIAGGAAGGFAGAKAGAAIGATIGSIIPGAGTAAGAVVGGVIGGIAGAIGGESIAKGAFNTVKGWFS